MINVIIFSDIKIYCEGLSRILSTIQPIRVVGAENSLEGALSKVDSAKPDIMLLDMTMRNSSQLARQVCEHFSSVRIVALAVSVHEQDIVECAQAGIAGYVARDSSLDELIDTVKGASRGEFRCSPAIAACMFQRLHDSSTSALAAPAAVTPPTSASPINQLTRREQQITGLMAEGLSNKQISSTLYIEVSTVKNHVHNILVKLNMHSRAQVANLLQQRKLAEDLDLRV